MLNTEVLYITICVYTVCVYSIWSDSTKDSVKQYVFSHLSLISSSLLVSHTHRHAHTKNMLLAWIILLELTNSIVVGSTDHRK